MAVTAAEAAAQLRSRAAKRARVAEQRAVRLLLGLVPYAAQLLRRRYGACGVLLLGSLAAGIFTDRSAVDLAVRGIYLANYFAALAGLLALLGGPVDLVRVERAPPSLVDRIAAEGRPA